MKLLEAGGSRCCPACTTTSEEQAHALRAKLGLPKVENEALKFNHDKSTQNLGPGVCVIALLRFGLSAKGLFYCRQPSDTQMSECPTGAEFLYKVWLENG
jgi:hypothetical protein